MRKGNGEQGSGRVVRSIIVLFLCFSVTGVTYAQDLSRNAYMVPSKVYVGDKARLILPLPAGFDASLSDSHMLTPDYALPEITIHRVVIERRPGGNSLVMEFSAYRPGAVELPPFEIAGKTISGLYVEISSILDSGESALVLSDPALPLAIPGTSFLVYGTISIIVLFLLFASWVLFGGRKRLNGWLIKWNRKRMLAVMRRTEKRLRKTLLKHIALNDDRNCIRREILDALSAEFRSFLTWLTGENCRAMTAVEIGCLGTEDCVLNGESLGDFFNRCDTVRFGGGAISNDTAFGFLDDLKNFFTIMELSSISCEKSGKKAAG